MKGRTLTPIVVDLASSNLYFTFSSFDLFSFMVTPYDVKWPGWPLILHLPCTLQIVPSKVIIDFIVIGHVTSGYAIRFRQLSHPRSGLDPELCSP